MSAGRGMSKAPVVKSAVKRVAKKAVVPKVRVTTKRVVPGFVLIAANDVFPTTPNRYKAALKPKMEWIANNQLWIDMKTNRVFTPVLLGSGVYWMDAITGSVYNVYTGQCQSNSTMCINLRHMVFNQEVGGEILISTSPTEGGDV